MPKKNENLIDDDAAELEALRDQLEAAHHQIAALVADLAAAREALKPWERRYANARERMDAFNKIAKAFEQIGFIPPANFRQ